MAMRDRFRTVLSDAASARKLTDSEGREGWIVRERQAMWHTVCVERAKLGLEPVALVEVERVERSAVGHIDYADKFALRCAELVYGPDLETY